MESVNIPVETMRKFIEDVFTHVGVPLEEAKVCANVLIASDLRGIESHGIQRLKMYYDRIKTGQQKAETQFEIVRESPTTAVVDGHHGMKRGASSEKNCSTYKWRGCARDECSHPCCGSNRAV